MRFVRNGVSEVIVTTDGPEGPNAAPMGVWNRDGRLFLRIFESATGENLASTGRGVLNVTWDPRPFVETALGSLELDTGGEMPRLDTALYYVDIYVVESWRSTATDELGESSLTVFEVEATGGTRGEEEVVPLSRGTCGVIDAAVKATRLVAARGRGLEEEAGRIAAELEEDASFVERCGGDRDEGAMDRLMELIG